MTDRNASLLALLGSVLLLPGCAAGAGGAASSAAAGIDTPKPALDDGPVARAAYAISLGQQGETNADAKSLRTAAQLLASLGAKPDNGEEDDLSSRWSEQASLIDPSITSPVYRGRALGPSYKKGTVSATLAVKTDQIFLAGKKAAVALVPVSARPMSIKISDGRGENVCKTGVSSKPMNCEWLPLFTGRYRIRIETSAREPAAYYLVSN